MTTGNPLGDAIITNAGYLANKPHDPAPYVERITVYVERLVALVPDAPIEPVPGNTSGLTPIGWAPDPANPPATVTPDIVARFVRDNPALDPTLAAAICQALGQAGASAQSLTGYAAGAYIGLTLSPIIPGLVVSAAGLPVYETQAVPSGTVLYRDAAGLGPGSAGDYIAGAWSAPEQAGHVSTAVGEILTPSGPAPITRVEPGTDGITIGETGSNILG